MIWSGIDQTAEISPIGNRRALVQDTQITGRRVKTIVSEQSGPVADPSFQLSFETAKVRAGWELSRRRGRSQAVSITCDSWRDTNGKLWTPNRLAPIDAPLADISNANWAIGSVTFRKDMSGTHADLILMDKEAFSPSPDPLNLFDNELAHSLRVQNPSPPSTGG